MWSKGGMVVDQYYQKILKDYYFRAHAVLIDALQLEQLGWKVVGSEVRRID
jgi:hypothetical protein